MIVINTWMTFGPPAVPFVAPTGGQWGRANFCPQAIVDNVRVYHNEIVEPGQTNRNTKGGGD